MKRIFGWLLRDARPAERKDAASEPSPLGGRRLVRDPMCGMHVAEELALAVRMGNDTMHFCSPECRDRYLSGTHKMVANG